MSTANGVLKIIVFFTQYDIIIMQALAGTPAKSIPKGEKTHVITLNASSLGALLSNLFDRFKSCK